MKVLHKEIENCDMCPCNCNMDWQGFVCNITGSGIKYKKIREPKGLAYEPDIYVLEKPFLDDCPLEDKTINE